MSKDEFFGFHLVYYFIISVIGGVFIYIGKRLPVYNEQTGEIIQPYSLPFIIIGCALIFLAFIGLAFFNEPNDELLL